MVSDLQVVERVVLATFGEGGLLEFHDSRLQRQRLLLQLANTLLLTAEIKQTAH